MISHGTRARDSALYRVFSERMFAAAVLVIFALPVHASRANSSAEPVVKQQPRSLVIGLTCEGSASPVRELHSWDARVPMGGVPEQCLDGNTKLRLQPQRAVLRYNRVTEHSEIVLTLSEGDGKKVGELFAAALKTGTRHDLILVDGKVIASAFIFGQFSGTILEIDAGSDEAAKAIVAVLNGS